MLFDAEQRHKGKNAALPSLSILMATTTYFTDVMMISVHTISDSTPSTTSGVGVPLVMLSTVLSVYSGLVPISPKTIPSAARPNAASPDRPTGSVESGCVGMLAFWFISRRELGLARCYRRSVIAELFYNALINLDEPEKLDRFLSARVQWILSAADPYTVGEEAPPPSRPMDTPILLRYTVSDVPAQYHR
jgi:hypothetical protein